MPHTEMKNAPPLYGWAIAVAAGAVATAVSFLLVGIEGNGSVAIGAVITLIVGVVFTIAERPPSVAKPGLTKQVTAPTVKAPPPAEAAVETPSAAVTAPANDAPRVVEDVPAAQEAKAEAAIGAVPGKQPPALATPKGSADDLKQISGLGPVLEGKLNEFGIYHFWQIAAWDKDEIAWMDETLNFKGRIERDDWVSQAQKLADANANDASS